MRKRVGRGGWRPGAGRKPGPPEKRRKHRVTVFLTDSEFAALTRLAKKRSRSLGTVAYVLVALGLSRAAPRKPKRTKGRLRLGRLRRI
jgi:hypothetical protein